MFECIETHKHFEEGLARIVFRQIVEAVYYMHEECGIVHRDIKDENVVVDGDYRVCWFSLFLQL